LTRLNKPGSSCLFFRKFFRLVPLAFREATVYDLPLIVEVYNSTIASRSVTADLEPVSVASRQAWFEGHDPLARPLWVVEADGVFAGWVSFQDFYGRPAYAATAEISLYLHTGFRGRGLGKAVLLHALRRCPALGILRLLGYVFAHNAPSLALFRGAGFAVWGELPGIALLDGVERTLLILGIVVEERS
jgi:phosphinothricin acetyltransferase